MTDRQSGNDMKTADAYVETARGWSRQLEDAEVRRTDLPLTEARPRVARKIGVPPGTLERLRNGRLKAIAVHVFERLGAAVTRELQNEMRQIEHDLQTIRQTGVDPRSPQVAETLAALAKARAALGLGDGR